MWLRWHRRGEGLDTKSTKDTKTEGSPIAGVAWLVAGDRRCCKGSEGMRPNRQVGVAANDTVGLLHEECSAAVAIAEAPPGSARPLATLCLCVLRALCVYTFPADAPCRGWAAHRGRQGACVESSASLSVSVSSVASVVCLFARTYASGTDKPQRAPRTQRQKILRIAGGSGVHDRASKAQASGNQSVGL